MSLYTYGARTTNDLREYREREDSAAAMERRDQQRERFAVLVPATVTLTVAVPYPPPPPFGYGDVRYGLLGREYDQLSHAVAALIERGTANARIVAGAAAIAVPGDPDGSSCATCEFDAGCGAWRSWKVRD